MLKSLAYDQIMGTEEERLEMAELFHDQESRVKEATHLEVAVFALMTLITNVYVTSFRFINTHEEDITLDNVPYSLAVL